MDGSTPMLARRVGSAGSAGSDGVAGAADRELERTKAELERITAAEPSLSLAIIGVMVLTEVIRQSEAKTLTQLSKDLDSKVAAMRAVTGNSISVAAGCQLFLQFVTRTTVEIGYQQDVARCKELLIERGEHFAQKAVVAKQRIGELGEQFIQDGSVLLVHSISRPLQRLLLQAAHANKRFTVYVTESRPTKSGYRLAAALNAEGIPCHVILDAAVGYFMGRMDLVLVGAEGVVENGGIINQIGTYQMAVLAKAAHKPFYVTVESYKFVRDFPLGQDHVDTAIGSTVNLEEAAPDQPALPASDKAPADIVRPLLSAVDYTPPSYITLLITDLGILTPSAVSDELIKLYG